MPHIKVARGLPGIRGLMAFRPDTAGPLNELVDVLLNSPGTLSSAERELIATYVSTLNDCFYCEACHGAVAAAHMDGDEHTVDEVKKDYRHAPISEKLKALLHIAGLVQAGGKKVDPAAVAEARKQGATDLEIHDTVLIAAAFCMYNRYVDGLATLAPDDLELYKARAGIVAREGYANANRDLTRPRTHKSVEQE